MNKKQIIVLWIGIAVIVLMGLFPPWTTSVTYVGHHFIWFHPAAQGRILRIDVPHLCVQWAMVVVITGGLIVTLKDKKPKDD